MTSPDSRPRVGLSRRADGTPVPSAAARARTPSSGGRLLAAAAWAAAIVLTLLSLGLRLHDLDDPHRFAFDETYYAKDAWSLLQHGYVQDYREDVDGDPENEIDDDIMAGARENLWTDEPSMIVHPEVGKWMIAAGESVFGFTPFGWRISAVVVGSLMVLVMCRLGRRLTGSTMLGLVAGLLLSLDGLQFVLSRLALLDIFLAFWLLLAVHCLVADRQWFRARLADLLERQEGREDQEEGRSGWGPVRGLLLRPWLIGAGVCFGLAVGTKWTALYPLAAFGLLCWAWSAGARRSFGVRGATWRSAVVDGLPAFGQLVGVALVVYVASWTGWLVHASEYEEHLSSSQYTRFVAEGETCEDSPELDDDVWPTATEEDASGPAEVVQSLRSLWYYHQDVYTFHTHFLNCSTHDYGSKPSGWLLLNRPVGVAADTDIEPGEQGCDAVAGSNCYRQVLLLGTPALWWGGCVALLAALALWVGARDWRFGIPIVGTASTWLPWLMYDDRPIFLFYAVAILPFVVLAITLVLGRLLGGSARASPRRTLGVVVGGTFVVLVLLNFAWFWPIFTNELITRSAWLDRIWFSRWI